MGRRPHPVPSPASGLPIALRARLLPLIGDEVDALEEAVGTLSPTSIRINSYKPFALEAEQVPWCVNGRYLNERPAFTLDPLLHAGAYYVQEASSMLIEQAVIACGLPDRDLLALDLCAAPGGKSTHLLSLLGQGSLLVVNEVDSARRHVLAENIWKQGAGNAVLTGSDPSHLRALPEFFDLVLIDAPCSGEGMFRKDAFARKQWSPALVNACARTQRDIVGHAWSALAPGGVLIYSTCTWEEEENEAQLRPLLDLGGSSVPITMDPSWGVHRGEVDGVVGYRCYPHRVRGEGFFLSVTRKPGGVLSRDRTSSVPGGAAPAWLVASSNMITVEHRDRMFALPSTWASTVDAVAKAMHIHAPGTPIGERKGAELVPHAAAALSRWLDQGAFPEVHVDGARALSFLRGEALPASGATGTALVTYQGTALGWVHGAGNRWNNRWPAPWRIRTQRSKAPPVSWHGR